jgi:hypothetical protein
LGIHETKSDKKLFELSILLQVRVPAVLRVQVVRDDEEGDDETVLTQLLSELLEHDENVTGS